MRKIKQNLLLSIIIPCMNEEGNILQIDQRLKEVLQYIECKLELIFIDDGSTDQTWNIIQNLSMSDPSVIGIKLSRNFGHQNAVSAGIDMSKGDAVIIIDADLQDPPELILHMIEKWKEGYEVVYAVRKKRKGESVFKLITAGLFYRLIRKITDINIPLDTGDFRLIDRKVVHVLSSLKEKNRFLWGLISWIGFRQTGIEYVRDKRHSGATKYPVKKMLRFAIDGITSFSGAPLKLATYFGFFSAFLSLIIIIYSVLIWLFVDAVVPGWTSTMIAVLFMGGIQLITLGIVGEYIRRIYDESKERPNYIIDHVIKRGSKDVE